MMRLYLRSLLCVLGVALLAGCSSKPAPETVGEVDLQRYQGDWYEIARLPLFFQRKCAQSEANYQLKADGSVAVTNRCRTLKGDSQQATGTAVTQPGRTDRLWVNFDNWFSRLFPRLTRGDYWILELEQDYSVALVGTPDYKYLWLLAREPQISEQTRDRMLKLAEQKGYDTSELIWRRADQQIGQ
jgi:apolipoprotein D and lipocalin family protein